MIDEFVMAERSALFEYLRLESLMLAARDADNHSAEDFFLDLMDYAWWEMTSVERNIVRSRGSEP